MPDEVEDLEARVKRLEAELASLRIEVQTLVTAKLQFQADVEGIRQTMNYNGVRPPLRG